MPRRVSATYYSTNGSAPTTLVHRPVRRLERRHDHGQVLLGGQPEQHRDGPHRDDPPRQDRPGRSLRRPVELHHDGNDRPHSDRRALRRPGHRVAARRWDVAARRQHRGHRLRHPQLRLLRDRRREQPAADPATAASRSCSPTASRRSPATTSARGGCRAPTCVVLNSYDQISQVQGIYYSTDGTTPTVMAAGSTATFTVSAEGPQTIKYCAIDTRGNKENLHTKTLYVDSTPPTTTSNAQASYPTTATIQLTASDARSGIAQTRYKLDSGAWQTGTQLTVGDPGLHTLVLLLDRRRGQHRDHQDGDVPHQSGHDATGHHRQRAGILGQGPGQRDALRHRRELGRLGDVLLARRQRTHRALLRPHLHRGRRGHHPQVLLDSTPPATPRR